MKIFVFLATSLAAIFSSPAASPTWQELSSHLFTNGPIIWEAPINNLPKSFWVYQKLLPRVFTATVISNAIVLASYQNRGIPSPSTNDTCIVDDPDCNCQCMTVCNFSIRPNEAALSFYAPNQMHSTNGIPSEADIVSRAEKYAMQLGVDLAQIVEKTPTSHFNTDTNDNSLTRAC